MNLVRSLARSILPFETRLTMRRLWHRLLATEWQYRGMSSGRIFDAIYANGVWGRDDAGNSLSGSGSHDPDITAPYIEAVTRLLDEHRFETVVDLGCGDFNLGRHFVGQCRHYLACDVSDVILEQNRRNFPIDNLEFRQLDIARDALPTGDLACIRQVLQHLRNSEIAAFVGQLNARKPFRYLLVSEHVPVLKGFVPNRDKPSGPNIRIPLKSGVLLHEPPFALTFKSMRVLCEASEPTCGMDAVIRSILYELY